MEVNGGNGMIIEGLISILKEITTMRESWFDCKENDDGRVERRK